MAHRKQSFPDESWKSATGAVRYSEIYNGEVFDAREEKKGWATAGFNDGDWKGAVVKTAPATQVIATYNEPVTGAGTPEAGANHAHTKRRTGSRFRAEHGGLCATEGTW
jgi:hypothetical protein